jgi:pilus assembly protein CpaB
MKVRLLAGLAALILAVAGTAVLVGYVGGAEARAQRGAALTEVFVVTSDVVAGTPGEQVREHLARKRVRVADVTPGGVTDLGSLAGRVAATDLLPGEQLLDARFVDPKSLERPGTVAAPDGMHEVTVQLGPDRVLGGRLTAGDTVGIFASFEDGTSSGGPETHLLFHKVLITSIQGAPVVDEADATATDAPPVPAGTMLVTFAQSPADAEKTVFAAQFGTIWLSKESTDADEGGTRVVTQNGFFS